ncbi:MAG TPA: ParB/RepB/Spo0J family partition protein [Paracoccus sp. (in: a-proteobacteria)]|uniref:ParB/RepB/Spo0J family partition protein n=1 Tax=uncultured Paracoccus sp. TaxID=189685 RepID=UPI002609F550|nr:ParB/RepB/Spo0J family partition protein [uncultured Paracoccus sp.]HMQ40347.1 ParB/RepB/Spo0J family partition protein [Paracoccus sp. (in: a-proteobacteria)]
MSQGKRSSLGRGLSALMADLQTEENPVLRDGALSVPIEQITPNPDQPRRVFDQAALTELADSIRHRGIIQPLIVRRHPDDANIYQIVAGERRWRAAQIAQLHELPVLLRGFSDEEMLEVAIIENIQRADLNAIDEAASYKQLMTRFGHTQEKLAEALGKSRSHIANLLRLLNLPEQVQEWVRDEKLSAGHARALVTAENPVSLARKVIEKDLSVRAVEALMREKPTAPTRIGRASEKDADTRALEGDLSAALKMRVQIKHVGTEGGQMVITYRDLEQLDKLCQILAGSA